MANFLRPDSTITIGGVKVKYYPINQHNSRNISMPPARTKSIIGVTIHNTDTINAASGTTMSEQYTRATVNGNMGTVRVHYYVDSVEAWQNLPATMAAWHAADGNGDGNMRTIAIECIMSKNYTEADRKAEDNAARIAADILRTHGLTIDNLYTHTHWLNVRDGKTGSVDYLNTAKHPYKMCPAYILPHWAAFKALVAKYMGQEAPAVKPAEPAAQPDGSFLVQVICSELNVRKGPGTEYPVSTVIEKPYKYTIIRTAKSKDGGTWGELKSGAGWINIGTKYVKRI